MDCSENMNKDEMKNDDHGLHQYARNMPTCNQDSTLGTVIYQKYATLRASPCAPHLWSEAPPYPHSVSFRIIGCGERTAELWTSCTFKRPTGTSAADGASFWLLQPLGNTTSVKPRQHLLSCELGKNRVQANPKNIQKWLQNVIPLGYFWMFWQFRCD